MTGDTHTQNVTIVEDKLSHDERVRAEAIRLAQEGATPGSATSSLLHRAKAYERFLKTGETSS